MMSEKVSMLEYRFNIFPAKFSWRDRVYHIDAVNECRTRRAARHYWVKCDGQMLHLMHLLSNDKWTVSVDRVAGSR